MSVFSYSFKVISFQEYKFKRLSLYLLTYFNSMFHIYFNELHCIYALDSCLLSLVHLNNYKSKFLPHVILDSNIYSVNAEQQKNKTTKPIIPWSVWVINLRRANKGFASSLWNGATLHCLLHRSHLHISNLERKIHHDKLVWLRVNQKKSKAGKKMTITMEKERENHIPAHVEGHRGRTQLNLQYLLLPKAVREVNQ